MRSALGWKTVDRGASGANRSRVTVNQSTALHNASLIDRKVAALPEAKRTALLSQVASDIERKKQVLSGSSVHRGLTSALTSALARTAKAKAKEGGQHVLDVVCLGLGSLYDGSVSGKTATVVSRGSINARFQLAALLLLVDSLGQQSATADSRDAAAAAIDDDAGWGVRLVAYDPMFNAVDRLVLAETKCTVLRANMEGRHPARQDAAATLFYMPHCGRLLYNNAVYANWGSGLRRMFIIGNSIVDAKTNAHHTQASRSCASIDALVSDKAASINEQSVSDEGFPVVGVFNDLHFTSFGFADDYWILDRCIKVPSDANVAESSEIVSQSLSLAHINKT